MNGGGVKVKLEEDERWWGGEQWFRGCKLGMNVFLKYLTLEATSLSCEPTQLTKEPIWMTTHQCNQYTPSTFFL